MKLIILIIIDIDKEGENGTMTGNILDNTTELCMIKYTFGEIFSSCGVTLCKNPSDQTVRSVIKMTLYQLGAQIWRFFFQTIQSTILPSEVNSPREYQIPCNCSVSSVHFLQYFPVYSTQKLEKQCKKKIVMDRVPEITV